MLWNALALAGAFFSGKDERPNTEFPEEAHRGRREERPGPTRSLVTSRELLVRTGLERAGGQLR